MRKCVAVTPRSDLDARLEGHQQPAAGGVPQVVLALRQVAHEKTRPEGVQVMSHLARIQHQRRQTGASGCPVEVFLIHRLASLSADNIRKSATRFPMRLKRTSYFVPKPPTAVVRVKLHFAWSKSATKFLCLPKWHSQYTDVIQTLFLLNVPASLHSLHVIWTSAITDAHT